MESFVFAFNALAPLLALAFIGYFLRSKRVVSKTFVSHLNKFIFLVALPALIFTTIANIEDLSALNWSVIWFATIMVLVVTVISTVFVLAQPKITSKQRPVVVQALFRGNYTLIGIPLALRLGGDDTLSVIVMLNAFLIPVVNFLSIFVFRAWQNNGKFGFSALKELLYKTVSDPLMIAVFLGIVAFVFQPGWFMIRDNVSFLDETLNMLSETATPMALIAVGGQFQLTRVQDLLRPIVIAVAGRLLILPALVFIIAYMMRHIIDFDGAWAGLIAIFASPTAVATVAVTQGLEGDDELASQILIWSTALAMFTIFFFVVVFRMSGLL